MTKDEYEDLLAEIGGGPAIGLVARQERDGAERAALAQHDTEFWALLCLGDAVHQFYRDTLDLIRRWVLDTTLTDVQMAMVIWHIVSFGRFAAAFHLMAHAYYFEAIALARDLWEVALSLAALRKRIVTLEELTASGAATRREMEQMSREVDGKIRSALIWSNPALSGKAREAVETFLGIANLATHKSKLHLALNLRYLMNREPVPIFPRFDLERAGAAHNMLYLATWSLIATLPYLEFALPAADPAWSGRYRKVLLAFEEGPGRGPNAVVQAWPEIIRGIFSI